MFHGIAVYKTDYVCLLLCMLCVFVCNMCMFVVCTYVYITYLDSASRSAFAENTSFSWFLLTPTSHGFTGPTRKRTEHHVTKHTTDWSHDSHVINIQMQHTTL